nr:hypothetical protein Iba_chr10cCG6290 [Ipomoea batatas]
MSTSKITHCLTVLPLRLLRCSSSLFHHCLRPLILHLLPSQCTKNLLVTLLAPFVSFNIWAMYNTPTASVVNPLAEIGDFDGEARVLAGVPRVHQRVRRELSNLIPRHNLAEFLTSAYDSMLSTMDGKVKDLPWEQNPSFFLAPMITSGKYWRRSELCLPRPWFSLAAAMAALVDQATTVLPGVNGVKNANGNNRQ